MALTVGLVVGGATSITAATPYAGGRYPKPAQEWGSAAGRPNLVDTAQTRANGDATGRPAGRAPGELDAVQGQSTPVPVESTPDKPPVSAASEKVTVPPPGPANTLEAGGGSIPPPSSSFDERTSREIPAERGTHTEVYANANGSNTLKVSQEPVNYRLPDGSWAKVDDKLVSSGPQAARSGSGSGSGSGSAPEWWRTKAAGNPVDIASRADAGRLATLHTGTAPVSASA